MPDAVSAVATSGVNVALDNSVLEVWSQEILFKAQPTLRFESICQVRTELGVLPGKSISFLKYSALGGDDSSIGEASTIDATNLATTTVAIAVSEQAKAVAMTEFLLRTSFLNVMENASTLLGMHYARTRDSMIRRSLMSGANVKYSQKGGLATSRANLVAGSYFDVNLIRDAVEFLATNKAPKFGLDAYVCFVHPHQARYLRADSAWINAAAYAAPEQLLNGEIGRIEDVRFIETTQVAYIPSGTQDIFADGVDTTANTSVAANSNTDTYLSIIVGDYAVGIAQALPVEMRDNGVQDYGRKHSLAYYGIYGSGLIETGHSCILETS